MQERFAMPQPAARLQRLFNLRVGVEYPHAAEQLDVIEEMARGTHRRIDLETVPHPGIEIVGSVSWSGVHRPRAGIERDVVPEYPHRIARIQWMAEPDFLQFFPLHFRDR